MTADQDVFAQSNGLAQDAQGNPIPGTQLGWMKVAYFYDANMFGLKKDYAFPEGPNESASAWNHMTSVAKLFTRTKKLADGNDYDAWDAIMTLCKAEVLANPHINDDEPNSVNYKPPVVS